MADQTAEFALKLRDEMSGSAASAAQALKQLRSQIQGDTGALAEMQKAMRNLQGGTSVNIEQFRKLKSQIDAKKQSIAQAQANYIALGGTFNRTASSGKGFAQHLSELGKQTQGLPGPLGKLVGGFERLSKMVGGGAIALGIVGIAAALAALVAATATATVALVKYGIAQADARRSELLRLEGMTKLRNLWGIAAGKASDVQDAIDRVSGSVSIGRDKVAGYAEQLYKMGLRGQNLSDALEGAAIKASAQGDAQANMFAHWSAGIALTGGSVRKFSDDVKARLGGVVQKQMLSLDVQAKKQQESFAALFTGWKIEAFLSGWKSIRDLLSQSTASGRALKSLLTSLLRPIINAATAAAPVIKRFFQGMILGALDIGIALQRVRLAFKRTFGAGTKSDFDLTNAAVMAGKVALFALAAGLTTAGVLTVGLGIKLTTILTPALLRAAAASIRFSFSGLTGVVSGLGRMAGAALTAAPALWATVAPMLPFVAAALGLGAAVYVLATRWDDLKLAFQQLDWKQAGLDAVNGILRGIVPGYDLIKEGLSKLGATALGAFKDALGISSPSKAFMQLGLQIPRGVTAGVEQGTPQAQQAAGNVVSPPTSSPAARGAGGGKSVTINELHVHTSSDRPQDVAQSLKREIEAVFENLAVELGAGEVST